MTCQTDLATAKKNQKKWRKILKCPKSCTFTEWCIKKMADEETLKEKLKNLVSKYK